MLRGSDESTCFIRPFEILEQIDLTLTSSLSTVHNVFYVSILQKYTVNHSHLVHFKPLHLNESSSNEENPNEILMRELCTLP